MIFAMIIPQLDSAISRYECELDEFKENEGNLSKQDVLKILFTRDTLRAALIESDSISPEKTIKILELDKRLKEQAGVIAKVISLAECRDIFKPPEDAWWWFLETPKDPLEQLDFIVNFVTVILVTISISLGVDIVSRFLSGGLNLLSSLVLGFQSLLTLVAASTLTNANAAVKFMEQIFHLFGVKKYRWQKLIQLGLALLLLIFVISFRHYLPQIAANFNERGLENYLNQDLATAQDNLERAIGLDPKNAEAHYNLGRIYEKLQDIDKAKEQYRLALRGNLDVAYNALGRLLLEDKKYSEAVSMFLQGLAVAPKEDKLTQAVLRKNLGWARLEQKRYAEAETALREAIELDNTLPSAASAHCILAEVLAQKQGAPKSALAESRICLGNASSIYPEEDTWMEKSRQRVDSQGNK